MPDPSLSMYLGVPGYVVLWLLALVAFGLFGRRTFYLVRVLLRGRPEVRWEEPVRRVMLVVKNVLGQRRLLNEPVIGAAHFLIFWAFVFYATSFFWNLIRGLVPALPIPYSDQVGFMALGLEMFGWLALISLIVAGIRRYVFTPERLELSRDASIILVLIATLLVTFLLGDGARAAVEPRPNPWTPVGNLLGPLFFRGVSEAGAQSLYLWMWWVHMATVLGFLAYLPSSKHLHLLASPFGVLFGSLQPGAMPASSAGAARLEDFTWRQLLSGLSCAECGRCDRACPAFNSGMALSPKMLIHHVKELVVDAVPALLPVALPAPARIPELGATMANGGTVTPQGKAFVGDVITREELWGCTTCASCMDRCPVFNEHIPLIVEMRRYLVSQGDIESRVQDTLTNLTRYGNSFGQSPRGRTKWTQGLEFKIKDARKEPVEYLWFVGDYASYDPRLAEISRTTARVFHKAGLDFGILYEGEQNSGNDVRRIGEEGLFEVLRDKNLQALGKARFDTIVTTDPHSYHVLRNEYPSNGNGHGPRVLHYTELLDRLVKDGCLALRRSVHATVTYHDPCYLGRYNGVYGAPRRLIGSLGVSLVEMPRNRSTAYCCGAGGGRIWMEDAPGLKERPSESRVREAAAQPGVQTLVVACPKDLVMFQDAIKTTGLEKQLSVADVIELVAEAAAPAN